MRWQRRTGERGKRRISERGGAVAFERQVDQRIAHLSESGIGKFFWMGIFGPGKCAPRLFFDVSCRRRISQSPILPDLPGGAPRRQYGFSKSGAGIPVG